MSLYSADRTLLSSSGAIYNPSYTTSGSAVESALSYQFSGFGERGNYYIRAQGKTQSGMNVDTGYIEISSNYASKSVFSMLKAENIPEDGRVYIKSAVISATCKVLHNIRDDDNNIVDTEEIPDDQLDSHNLLYGGQYINPQNNQVTTGNHALILPEDYYMLIDEGYQLGTFSNTLIFINPAVNVPILTYSNSSNSETVDLYYRVGKYAPSWQTTGTPTEDTDVIVRYSDTTHGGYLYGWSSWNSQDGWSDVILKYEDESGNYTEATADWSGDINAWAYPVTEDQACFELVVSGTVNDVYVSNVITKAQRDERIGVVIVRDDYGRYDISAHNGFNLTDPKESYAASTSEDIG